MNINNVPNVNVREKLAALEGQDIKDPSAWEVRERILNRHTNGKEMTGLCLPWVKTADKVRLRSGEISIWAGYNGHNKSTILNQVAVNAAQFVKVGIGSFEMELEDTYNLLAKQAGGVAEPSTRWVNDFCSWAQNKIYCYDRLESVPAEQVLSGVDYMAGHLGCKLIVIDSLMMVRGVVDDMEREKDFISLLAGMAKHYQTHIAIVHHMKKPQQGNESTIPGKYDLRGSAAISDLAHSVFICWCNKELKQINDKRRAGIPLTTDETTRSLKLGDSAEQLLIVAKQRHAPFEGGIGLWQHESRQFTSTSSKKPMLIDIPRLAA